MSLDKKAIKSTIKSQLAAGKDKTTVYNELKQHTSDGQERKQLADWVRYTPEPWRLKKYGIYNTLFLVLLSVLLLFSLFTSTYGGAITLALLILIVADKYTKYYYLLSVYGLIIVIFGVGMGIHHFVTDDGFLYQLLYIVVALIVGGLFIYFGHSYPDLLTPPYQIIEDTRANAQGRQIQQRRVVFEQ